MIPQLNPGDIIILDNATFHRGETIREIVENAGCEIWYLPAYSPDLNKIENWWSVLIEEEKRIGGLPKSKKLALKSYCRGTLF